LRGGKNIAENVHLLKSSRKNIHWIPKIRQIAGKTSGTIVPQHTFKNNLILCLVIFFIRNFALDNLKAFLELSIVVERDEVVYSWDERVCDDDTMVRMDGLGGNVFNDCVCVCISEYGDSARNSDGDWLIVGFLLVLVLLVVSNNSSNNSNSKSSIVMVSRAHVQSYHSSQSFSYALFFQGSLNTYTNILARITLASNLAYDEIVEKNSSKFGRSVTNSILKNSRKLSTSYFSTSYFDESNSFKDSHTLYKGRNTSLNIAFQSLSQSGELGYNEMDASQPI